MNEPSVILQDLKLRGEQVEKSFRNLRDLEGYFLDVKSYSLLNQDRLVYEVESYMPINKGTEGGLFYGLTTLYPGKVGSEYHMTKGHFHELRSRTEFYWCLEGVGVLLLMDDNRKTWAEKMIPGSIHFISGHWAHRVCNTGKKPLVFGACWPSDAGYNYTEILIKGFSSRMLEVEGLPTLVNETDF